jgi:hypothetical protein
MKSKAKPAKGSARTKRFDVGGTVGALAGLGTLAYLMSRKKKGAAAAEGPEFKPQGKFPSEAGSGTSGPGMADTTTNVDDAGRQRALRQSKGQGDLVPEGADLTKLNESDKALVRTDGGKTKPVVRPTNVNKNKPRQGSNTTTSTRLSDSSRLAPKKGETRINTPIVPPKDNDTLSSRPYPSNSKKAGESKPVVKKEAAAKPSEKKPGDVTFLTKERSDKAAKAMKEGRNMGLFERGYPMGKKKGGAVKSASSRADGIAIRGKTRA